MMPDILKVLNKKEHDSIYLYLVQYSIGSHKWNVSYPFNSWEWLTYNFSQQYNPCITQ